VTALKLFWTTYDGSTFGGSKFFFELVIESLRFI